MKFTTVATVFAISSLAAAKGGEKITVKLLLSPNMSLKLPTDTVVLTKPVDLKAKGNWYSQIR